MSEVISHLAEPFIDRFGDSPERLERVISFTITAWNLTLLPAMDREETLAKIVHDNLGDDPELTSSLLDICNLIAERKRRFYPNLKHFIVDFHFRREEKSVYFDVAYAIEGGKFT